MERLIHSSEKPNSVYLMGQLMAELEVLQRGKKITDQELSSVFERIDKRLAFDAQNLSKDKLSEYLQERKKELLDNILTRIESETGDRGNFEIFEKATKIITAEVGNAHDENNRSYFNIRTQKIHMGPMAARMLADPGNLIAVLAAKGSIGVVNEVHHEYIHSLQIRKSHTSGGKLAEVLNFSVNKNVLLKEVHAFIGADRKGGGKRLDPNELRKVLSNDPYRAISTEEDIRRLEVATLAIKQLYALGLSDEKIGALIREAKWDKKTGTYDALTSEVAKLTHSGNLYEGEVNDLVKIDELRTKLRIEKTRIIAKIAIEDFLNKGKDMSFEVMKTPEIVVQEERGAQLFSLLLKAENPKWGETETPLAKETTEYLRNHPLDPEILKTIRGFQEQGIDEETLYNVALTYQHPERVEGLFEMATEHKPHVKNPREAHQKLMNVLVLVDHIFSSSPLARKFATEIEQDRNKRLKKMTETKEWIESLITFFKPDSKTTTVRKLSFVPTDPLYRTNSGRAFSFPGEQIIISYIDNVGNQKHEFLHGIVNPIVDKLSQKLTSEQKEKISKLGSAKLKQDYGDGHFSLLCEELIRTYLEVFRNGKKPESYEEFKRKISSFNDEDFQKELRRSSSLKVRCEKLGIKNIDDLKSKSKEYFEQFEKNQLRDLLFELYQEYVNRSNKNMNFEQFILDRFARKL